VCHTQLRPLEAGSSTVATSSSNSGTTGRSRPTVDDAHSAAADLSNGHVDVAVVLWYASTAEQPRLSARKVVW
jgi:hypothetical protein